MPFRGDTDAAVLNAILHDAPPNPIRLNPDVPAELDAIVMKLLKKDRRLRYQHAGDLKADLTRVAQQTALRKFSTGAGPATPGGGAVPSSRRARFWRWAAVAALGVAAVAGLVLWQSRGAQALGEADVILLTDFTNSTGDSVFDGALRQAVAVKLEESPFSQCLPGRTRAADAAAHESTARHTDHQRDRPRSLPARGDQGDDFR
jgi:hypothetical protein